MRPPPQGSITKFGYRRFQLKNRKMKFEHVLVWEAVHGPVPKGKELHHINGDKLDNRIENLKLVTRLEHKRIESGCYLSKGAWWKRCRRCRWYRSIETDFYVYPGRSGVMSVCKRCAVDLAIEGKRKRRARRKAEKQANAASSAHDNALVPVATQPLLEMSP